MLQDYNLIMRTHAPPPLRRRTASPTKYFDVDNQVLLADFGFAKALEEGEAGMTGLCGTKVGNTYWCDRTVTTECLGIVAFEAIKSKGVRATNYTSLQHNRAPMVSPEMSMPCLLPGPLPSPPRSLTKKESIPGCQLSFFSFSRCFQPYLSPEQVNGLPYGTSSDMWAAGVVMYELLHGRTAFW